MLKRKSIAILFILPFLLGSVKSPQKVMPDAFLSQAEAKLTIENASPQDKIIIPKQTVLIHWSTRLNSTGQVKYRKTGTSKWKTIKSSRNTMHSIELDGLKPGEQWEYSIDIDLKEKPIKGAVRTFSVATGGLVFAKKENHQKNGGS